MRVEARVDPAPKLPVDEDGQNLDAQPISTASPMRSSLCSARPKAEARFAAAQMTRREGRGRPFQLIDTPRRRHVDCLGHYDVSTSDGKLRSLRHDLLASIPLVNNGGRHPCEGQSPVACRHGQIRPPVDGFARFATALYARFDVSDRRPDGAAVGIAGKPRAIDVALVSRGRVCSPRRLWRQSAISSSTVKKAVSAPSARKIAIQR